MARSLVLGSEGFVGRSLCDFLREAGDVVDGVDIKNGSQYDLRTARIDLADSDDVYFCAWEVGGAKFLYRDDAQARQLEWNLPLMQNVFTQCARAGSRVVFASSQLATEVDTVYGVTKRLGEVWSRLIGAASVRIWNVYGAVEPVSLKSHVASDLVHQGLTTGEIRLMTTGEELRQFVHIDDVCAALQIACRESSDEIYDVTSFEWTRVRDVAEIVASLTQSKLILGEQRGTTPRTPIRGKLPGWYPRIGLEEGLARLVESTKSTL